MIQKLICFKSTDNIELPGILYSPENDTKKIVVHIHGLTGNFYEKYISYLAESYISKGYAFLCFNNRGNGYFTDLIIEKDGEIKNTIGGACYELFNDSVKDIDGIFNWVKENGYTSVILSGHSYGTNKATNYYIKKQPSIVEKIVLLAPCDNIAKAFEKFEGRYEESIEKAKQLVDSGKGYQIVNAPTYQAGFCANTLYTDYREGTDLDIFRYRIKDYINKDLTDIKVPVLVILGDKDRPIYSTTDKETVHSYLQNNLLNSTLKILNDCGHTYKNKGEDLANIIKEWLD